MFVSKKAIGKRFGLLTALVAALMIACTGVIGAQSSSPNAGYENPNPVTTTPVDAPQSASETASNVTVETIGIPNEKNGNFETGDFTHWNSANLTGGFGDWFVYEGTESPLSVFNIAAPPQGDFAAVTDQEGPGSHVLYRNIKLAPGMRHELSFYLYYRNRADSFYTPKTLDYTEFPNRQYRVDVLKPTANPFTVNRNDILARLFRTEVGDPNSRAPTLMTFNLTQFAGKTVRLRFAEVDNQFYFQASVDKVKVTRSQTR